MTPQHEEALRMLRLAERDMVAFDILRETPPAHITIVCFHAQQAVEKCLKAVLFEHGHEFRRTHDLEELAAILLEHRIDMPTTGEQLALLNPYAVMFRYDEVEDTETDLIKITAIVQSMHVWAEDMIAGESVRD